MTEPLEFDATIIIRRRSVQGERIVATVTASGVVAVPAPEVTPPVPVPVTPAPGTLGSRLRLGAFVYQGLPGVGGTGDPWDPAPHQTLESKLGVRLSPVSCFLDFATDFPTAQFAAYGDRDILISWHPDAPSAADILAGKLNAYLDRWATAVDAYTGGQVYIRLMPEFNGSWARWCPTNTSATSMMLTGPAHWVKLYRYIVDRIEKKTNKVAWVWCPNITDEPNQTGNRLEEFYPGSDHVDVLGFDGYNWGDSGYGNFRWTSFADLIGTPQGSATKSIYDRLTALHPTAQVWLCEFGCKEPSIEDGKYDTTKTAPQVGLSPVNPGKSKAQWYADMLNLAGFERLTTVVAFDIAKERDWRLTSSPGVVEAIAKNLLRH